MDPETKKRVLITGAGGFLGSRLMHKMLAQTSLEIMGMLHKRGENMDPGHLFVADLLDPETYENQLEGVDTVIHMAQTKGSFEERTSAVFSRNLRMTTQLVDSCLAFKVKKLIFLSSASTMIRTTDSFLVTSEGKISPTLHTHYSKTKYKEELEIRRGEAEGLQVAILNPSPICDRSTSMEALQMNPEFGPFSSGFLRNHIPLCPVNKLEDLLVQLVTGDLKGEQILLCQKSEEWNPDDPAYRKPNPSYSFMASIRKFFFGTRLPSEAAFLASGSLNYECK
jgi:nucleoside-diphosphate-sugar epimerase